MSNLIILFLLPISIVGAIFGIMAQMFVFGFFVGREVLDKLMGD